jgi:hypothetical protein
VTADHNTFSPVGKKLREMGFVPLPRWWVTPEELEIISRITKHHLPTVLKVKEGIRMEQELEEYGRDNDHGWSK